MYYNIKKIITNCNDYINIFNSVALANISFNSFYNGNYSEGCIHVGILSGYLIMTYENVKNFFVKIPEYLNQKMIDIYYRNRKNSSKNFMEIQRKLINKFPNSLPEPEFEETEELEETEDNLTKDQFILMLKEKLPGTSFIKAQKQLDTYFENCILIPKNQYYNLPENYDENLYHIYVNVYDKTWRLHNQPSNNTLILDVI